MPAARTPAQIEAARRNGARSRGPVSDEGKARSCLNALCHGLAAADHLFLKGEDASAYAELLRGLVDEHAPAAESEARLVQRLASAVWRELRADRLEAKLIADAPQPRYITANGFAHVDPEITFDLKRFEAIRRYRAEASREAARVRRELRALRDEAPAGLRDEPGADLEQPCLPRLDRGVKTAGTSLSRAILMARSSRAKAGMRSAAASRRPGTNPAPPAPRTVKHAAASPRSRACRRGAPREGGPKNRPRRSPPPTGRAPPPAPAPPRASRG